MKRIISLTFLTINFLASAQSASDKVLIEASRFITVENYQGAFESLQKADKNDYRVQYFLIVAEFRLLQQSGAVDFYSVNNVRTKSLQYLSKFKSKNAQWSRIVDEINDVLDEINPAKDPYQFSTFIKIKEKYKDFFDLKYDDGEAKKFEIDLNYIDDEEMHGNQHGRDKLLAKIRNYKAQSCDLRLTLDKLKVLAKVDNSALIAQYTSLKKNYAFPYLQKIIADMSKNLNSYQENSLPACQF